MQETQFRSLDWEDTLEKGRATCSSILPGEFHGQRRSLAGSPWGWKESDTTERLTLSHTKSKSKNEWNGYLNLNILSLKEEINTYLTFVLKVISFFFNQFFFYCSGFCHTLGLFESFSQIFPKSNSLEMPAAICSSPDLSHWQSKIVLGRETLRRILRLQLQSRPQTNCPSWE